MMITAKAIRTGFNSIRAFTILLLFFLKPSCRFAGGILIFLLLPFSIHAASSNPSGRVWSIQFENDFFGGGTDRHFTHGTRIQCLTKPISRISDMANKLPWFDTENISSGKKNRLKTRASISIGQNIYTPEEISAVHLLTDDRPYAGHLYAGIGLVADQGNKRYDKLELTLGVIGPRSLGEDVQKSWHSLFGLQRPNGWDHQLDDEPAVNLFYEQARRFDDQILLSGLEYDLIPHFGAGLGNVFVYGSGGMTIRLGPDLSEDFGPPRIQPSLPGGGYLTGKQKINWYLFAGMGVRVVLHNIFLDGNTFQSSHFVDKKNLVGDLQAGLAVRIYRFRIAYTQIYRTKEFKEQNRGDKFGALSVSYQF